MVREAWSLRHAVVRSAAAELGTGGGGAWRGQRRDGGEQTRAPQTAHTSGDVPAGGHGGLRLGPPVGELGGEGPPLGVPDRGLAGGGVRGVGDGHGVRVRGAPGSRAAGARARVEVRLKRNLWLCDSAKGEREDDSIKGMPAAGQEAHQTRQAREKTYKDVWRSGGRGGRRGGRGGVSVGRRLTSQSKAARYSGSIGERIPGPAEAPLGSGEELREGAPARRRRRASHPRA